MILVPLANNWSKDGPDSVFWLMKYNRISAYWTFGKSFASQIRRETVGLEHSYDDWRCSSHLVTLRSQYKDKGQDAKVDKKQR